LWSGHDHITHHYRRYTKKGLKKICNESNNLSVKKISYFNFFLFPIIFLFRLFKKIFFFNKNSSDFFMTPKFLNYFLENIFACESYFLHWINLPIGTSLVCVLQKRQ